MWLRGTGGVPQTGISPAMITTIFYSRDVTGNKDGLILYGIIVIAACIFLSRLCTGQSMLKSMIFQRRMAKNAGRP